MSARGPFTCVLTNAGGVQCWGYNSSGALGDGTYRARGTPAPVSGLAGGVAAISAGQNYVCALTTTGGVKSWGGNTEGQLGNGHPSFDSVTPSDVSGLTTGVVAVSSGERHACAVTSVGGVKCWGYNIYGQVGDGTWGAGTNRSTPVDVKDLASGVALVAAGGFHTCALTAGGGVKCWGNNAVGQLGDGSITQHPAPVDVSSLATGVVALSAGYTHTCALTAAGGVKCWGDNENGQLGDGTWTSRQTPVDVSGLTSGVTAIAAGSHHTCALTSTRVVKCWGKNGDGQLGDGTATDRTTPVTVNGLVVEIPGELSVGTKAVSAGANHTCAVAWDGSVRCWGSDSDGQLGTGSGGFAWIPAAVVGLADGVADIATGASSCAVTTGGAVKCWGQNQYGQLGDGTTRSRATPANVTGLTSGVRSISVGEYHGCVVTVSGAIKCWGYALFGQLGNGWAGAITAWEPVDVLTLTAPASAVAAGHDHTCALMSDGGVKCWGHNADGELGNGTTIDRPMPVDVAGLPPAIVSLAAGSMHTCALTAGGGVKCWGFNYLGQLGDGTKDDRLTPVDVVGLSGATVIAAHGHASCAVTGAGDVKCWGGGVTTPTNVEGLTGAFVALAVGEAHVCGLTGAGGVKCRGYNDRGQLGDGSDETFSLTPVDAVGLTSGVKAIAAGANHTCALTSAGAVRCWGDNESGNVGDGRALFSAVPVRVVGFWGVTLGPAAVAFANTSQAYDGTPRPVTVTTFPAGLAVSVSYAGTGPTTYGPTTTPPTDAGTYTAVATVTEPGYSGASSALFTINHPIPVIARVSPSQIVAIAGTFTLTVNGSNFVPGAVVVWNGVRQRTTVYVSSSELRANVTIMTPPQAATVVVQNPVPALGPSLEAIVTVRLFAGDGIEVASGPGGSPNPLRSHGTAALSVTAFDFLGHSLAYSWTAACPWAGSDGTFTDRPTATPTWQAPVNGTGSLQTCVMKVTLDDNQGHTEERTYEQEVRPAAGTDFDGDGLADWAVFRPSTGEWLLLGGLGPISRPALGRAADIPVAGDYNGDGRLETAVFRPGTGEWLIENQATVQLGQSGDVPVPGDYDGDGVTEIAVYRPSTGEWLVAGQPVVQWGYAGDVPVPADYDGDGKTEMGIFRRSRGDWWIFGAGAEVTWGGPGDVPVPADYNGDGKDEIAVYRPATGEWLVQGIAAVQWGATSDVPVPVDVNGDGAAETVVFQPASATWRVRYRDGSSMTQTWGAIGDIPIGRIGLVTRAHPVQNDFDGDGRADLTVVRLNQAVGTPNWWTRLSSTGEVLSRWFPMSAGDVPVPGDYLGMRACQRATYQPAAQSPDVGAFAVEDGPAESMGQPGAVPVPGDYDGDGLIDLALYGPGAGEWQVLSSTSGTITTFTLGASGDTAVPADYDGDGITDVAVFTPSSGTWSVRLSSSGFSTTRNWQLGTTGDTPMPADYDGDGLADIAVYRPSTSTWHVMRSSSAYAETLTWTWGTSDDVPVAMDVDGDGRADVGIYRPSTGEWLFRNRTPITLGGGSDYVPVVRYPIGVEAPDPAVTDSTPHAKSGPTPGAPPSSGGGKGGGKERQRPANGGQRPAASISRVPQ